MKKSYLVIFLAVLATALLGSWITNNGMDWYATLRLPGFTPAGSVIGTIWTVIFVLCIISASMFWNKRSVIPRYKTIIGLFIANALLNVLWSGLFFGWHLIAWSLLEMVLLNLINLLLIIFLWRKSLWSSLLLLPYFVWVCIATYLNYLIWFLNR
ncbi:MAG: TspO/MBR family protein [Patescibacteria group bacterium]